MRIRVRSLVAAIIFLIVLRPNPGLWDQIELIGGALLWLLPIALFLYWLHTDYHLASARSKKLALPNYTKFFFVGISAWIVFAGLLSFISGTSGISMKNVGEFFRYPVYFLIFSAGYYAALFVEDKRFLTWLCWATLASCIVAGIQLLTIPKVYDVILRMYGDFKLRSFAESLRNFRVYGTFRNANWFGMFLVIVLPFVFYHYRLASLWKRLFVYGAVLLSIFASGSRSAWVGVFLVVFANVFYVVSTRVRRRRRHPVMRYITPLVLLAVIALVLISTLDLPQNKRVDQFVGIFTPSSDEGLFPSAQGRLDAWIKYLDIASTRPLIGFGPSQDWIGIPENGFIVLFVKYGIVGPLFLVGFLGSLALAAYRSRTLLGLSLATSVLIMAYGNLVQDLIGVIQVTSIALFVYGFTLSLIYKRQGGRYPDAKCLPEGGRTV